MTRKRLRVSKLDGRRYSYPYPIYYRPPLRWITPSFTTKKVTLVARDFGPEILHAIHHNNLEFLQRILENRLRDNSLITKLCMMDVGRGAASRRVSCPLIVASQKKDPTILRYMLEKGADPNYVEYTSRRPHGYCALHTAAKLGFLETVETLLLFKANPNAADSRGETALLIAVHASNCALAKLLLSHGANPNTRDKHGCAPLHIATSHGHLEMVSLLLAYGADLKLPNRNGVFPVHIAASAGHAHLIEALLGTDTASVNAPCLLDGIRQMPLHLAAGKGHAEVVSALLDFRADVNVKDSAANTALHHVVLKPYQANTMRNMNHFFATAQALIKAGIRVNDENNLGATPLVLAASNQFPKVAKLILSAGGELHVEPETLRQILLEQNILTAKNPIEALTGKQTDHLSDTLPKQTLPSSGNHPSFPAGTADTRNRPEHKEQEIKTSALESKPDSQANKESHPLKEIQSNVANSHLTNLSAQASDVFTKRYPLPKSDLRNYQQFRHSPTIENEISTFTVTANKGAERMCILFDKNSPSGKKVTTPKKGSENEVRPYIQKKSISTSADITKPATKRLKSTDDNTMEEIVSQQEDHLAQSFTSPEQKQHVEGKNDQKQDSSKISQPRTFDLGAGTDESVKKHDQHPVTENSDEEEESCWIDHKVEREDLLAPGTYRGTRQYSAPSYRHYSKSPSGFRSEGGGLRGLRLRVTGEVPKAYTCKQKAAKRRAFILAQPVGIESTGDFDRTHLSMSSLPEIGGLAWEKAMQRRLEWTEPPKPIFTGQKTPPSREFSPTSSTGKRNPKSDYRITGLFPQPYKSFGKIETKTDAIEAALMDYESDEEYESDSDVEPITTQWVSEMTERQWHRIPPESDEPFDTSLDDIVNANVLDESISSVEAEQIAGFISNGYLVGITEEERSHGQPLTDTDEELEEETEEETEEDEAEEEEDEEEIEEQQKEERKEKGEVEQRNEAKAVQSQATSGKSGVGVLRVLHGYPSKGAPSSNGSMMVVSSMEPEIQRLTIDNIVIADSSTSDDQEDDEISDLTKSALPMQVANNTFSESGKGDTSEQQKEKDGETPVNEKETGDVHHERKEDLMRKQSKVSPGGAAEKHAPDNEERLIEGENLEEPKKKGKKGKKSLKQHMVAGKDAEEYENAVGEEIHAETVTSESPVKRKKKSKSKATEKEPFVEEPETKPHIEENVVTKDISKSQTPPGWYDVDNINKDIANNVYSEEPTRRRRKAEEKARTEGDDHAVPKQLRGKEEEVIFAYSEEPERRGKHRKEQTKVKESEERRDESQEHIAENIDSEQPIAEEERTVDVLKKPRELQSEEEANIKDEDFSHQVYDEEPGSRRKPSRREKANEMAKDVIPDHMEGQEIEQERLSQGELASDAVINKSKKAKQKKAKDISSRKDIPEQTQNEDAGKSQVNDELQKPLERKQSGKRKPVTSQIEEVIPVGSEVSEIHREGVETVAVEDSGPTGKPDKKKTKKKAKGKADGVTAQQHIEDFAREPKHDHSIPAENVSDEQNNLNNTTNEIGDEDSISAAVHKQDGTSFENFSESIGEESSFVEPGKKAKKSKKTMGKDVGMNNNWGINSAVHSEVWQEAMNEEPLASSETVYEAMNLSDAEKAKAKKVTKKKSSAGKKPKNIEAETVLVDDLSNNNLMVKGKRNSAENNDDLVQTTHEQQISFPVRPVKETDIDDEFGDNEYHLKTSLTPDFFAMEEEKADRRARATMETSVDDIMDELLESNDDLTSNYFKPIETQLVKKRQKSRETSIDDDLDDDLPAYPETAADGTEESDSELKVERSLETNVDEYSEEPFVRRSTQKSNKASTDAEKSHPVNIREAVESKASKVTNVDEYHVVTSPFGVEIKLKQPDSRVQHMADTEGTEAPGDSEQLEAVESQKRKKDKKGKKKKAKPVASVQQAQGEEKHGGQSEMQELQNAEENHVVDAEEETNIKREDTKKQTKAGDEELNELTYPETGDAEDVQKQKRKKKARKQMSDKALKDELEENLEDASSRANMRNKKAESAYEDNNVDEEINDFNEETEIDLENDDVTLYPPKREHIIDAFVREARIDEDEENEDEEATTEVKESDHDEASIAEDLDEDLDLDDEDQQKVQRQPMIKIKRFREDSSQSEDNDEIIPQNALKTFNIETVSKKMREKSVTKKEKPEKEVGSDEDFGEIKRRKKTRKPVGEEAYNETGIDEDLDNITRQENGQKVKTNKVTEGDRNMDHARISPEKIEHVRGPALRETGIDDDIESQDEEEMVEVQESGQKETGIDKDLDDKGRQKLQREKIKIKRFGEDSSPGEDSDEIMPQNALKTFNIGTESQKKKQEKKPVTKKEKPEKEMESDEDFDEIRRRKKTRKPVGEAAYNETGIDEDLDNIKRQEPRQKERANKLTKGDKDIDHARIHPEKIEHIRGAAFRETGIDDDIESQDEEEMVEAQESGQKQTGIDEDLDDKGEHKIQREKIKIKRFGEDSSLSEDSEEIIPQNTPRTFNIGTGSQKKKQEKPVTKKDKPEKEVGSDEDFGEIKRRKKTRKPVGEAAYNETGIDEDLDNIKRQETTQKVRANKVSKGDKDMDHARIHPEKIEHVRGAAFRETGIDDDIESQDEEEMVEAQESGQKQTGIDKDLDDKGRQKLQREKIKIKRFGEDSSPGEDSDEIMPQNALKTFNIGTESQKKEQEKQVTKKEKPEKEMESDEDFGEIKRRKKTRKPVGEATYNETGIDEDLDNIKRQEPRQKERANKVTKGDTNIDHARISPEKQEYVRGPALRETGIDDDTESQDEEEMVEAQESGQKQTGIDEGRFKIQREKLKIKRYGEDSSPSEDSDEIIPQNAPKTFNIGTESQKKKQDKKPVTQKEKPEKEMESDEDFGEIRRRKKTRKPVGEAAYNETGIDENLENIKRQEKQQVIAKDRGRKDTGVNEDLDDDDDDDDDDDRNKKPTRQSINIRRFREDSSHSEDDDVGQDAEKTAKTFKIGTNNKTKTEGKLINKISKPTPDTEIGADEDYGEMRRRQKQRKHIAKTAYTETGIDDDLDDNLPKDTENALKSVHAGTKLSASGKKKTQEPIAAKQTEPKNVKERNALKFNKAGSEIRSEEEWTEEGSEEEEVEEEPIAETKRRTAKELLSKSDPQSRKHSRQHGKAQVSDEEMSNKEIESGDEEADDFEYRRRTKGARVSTGRPTDNRSSATVTQNDKILSETNFDQLSESEDSDEHHMRVTAKVEALLSKKKQFDEQEFDQNEENKVQTPNISSFMGTDDDSRNRKSIQLENVERSASDKKQQQQRFLETDESEEVGGSFSRKQAGRVSRGRVKKGPRKIQDPTLEASSNADTEGSSRGDPNEDGRRRSAKLRNWNTEETEITETEITETEITSEQDQKNRQLTSQARKSTPSVVTANDKVNEETKRKSLQQTQPFNRLSQGPDLDESIRRKRRMEMTEEITTTITTSPVQDNSLSPSGTENSSYSLPSPPTRQAPKKRDIQPMNISAPLLQETTFDVEPPPARKPALDISSPEVTPSKTDPFTRNTMDASLLRKSITMEKAFQQKVQRQHSAESLNRHRPRSQINEHEVKKSTSDANLSRRKRSSLRSSSTGHLDLSKGHYNGLYRTQREQKMRPVSFKQPDKTLQEAALETITTNAQNETRWLRRMDEFEKTIVYTRGVYRPQPVYWRGSKHGANPNDESRISALQVPENLGLNESAEDAGNKTAESLDKSKQNGNSELNSSAPPKLSLSKDGDESENRNSAFAAYNKRVTIHEEARQPQQFYGRRRHSRRSRTMRPSRDEPYKAPQITEPIAVDFSKYGIVAQLWMEQVDMKTVLKSKTMYLSIMPVGVQPPEEIMRSIRHVPMEEDQSAPEQWIIARGRTIRRQKRNMDGHRMSESFFLSGADSDPDLSRSANPMSPGKQSLLFFKVGGRWPDLAWALFEGIHTDAATLRMIKDIQLKNPARLTDQIQDMMNRWWTQKGQAATIEELRRSLELINLPFVQDETLNVTMANSFFSTSDLENKLAFEEVEAADPEVSRMIHEYNQHSHNASFNADHRQSPQTAQPFSSDALLRQMQQKGLTSKSSPNLRNSQVKPGDNWGSNVGRSDSRDGSFFRHQSRNESLRLVSSQDSLNTENVGEDKRKSFMIVQPQLKTSKDKKFRHESNM